jgi:hypothetical protein
MILELMAVGRYPTYKVFLLRKATTLTFDPEKQ